VNILRSDANPRSTTGGLVEPTAMMADSTYLQATLERLQSQRDEGLLTLEQYRTACRVRLPPTQPVLACSNSCRH
jgi:hypothetical protein